MANYARVTLIGTIGKDPEQKQAGRFTVVEASLAVNHGKDDKKTTNWYKLTFWNKQGDVAMQYVKKGDQLFVEGRLQVRDYTKADGTQGYSLEVTVSDLQLIGSKPAAEGASQPAAPAAKPAPAPAPATANTADDDLPF